LCSSCCQLASLSTCIIIALQVLLAGTPPLAGGSGRALLGRPLAVLLRRLLLLLLPRPAATTAGSGSSSVTDRPLAAVTGLLAEHELLQHALQAIRASPGCCCHCCGCCQLPRLHARTGGRGVERSGSAVRRRWL
jgi:hypothetical protein